MRNRITCSITDIDVFWNGIKCLFPKWSIYVVGLNIFRCQISTEAFLHMRYSGTDCALMCTAVPQKDEKVNCYFLVTVKLVVI